MADVVNTLALKDGKYLELIDLIDHLRQCRLDRYVSLPQIVVCGDQSSGKSSVLEALTGVKFPVGTGTCTRFATELCLRRADTESASASVVPGPRASEQHIENLADFSRTAFALKEMPALVEEAKKLILNAAGGFSEDKLRLELKGPELPNFTLIDTPGIIHSVEDGGKLVRELVLGYMRQPLSMILAIYSAEADPALQVISNLIKEADPGAVRTVGVITKADLVGRQRIKEFSKLARNQSKPELGRGWYVVRNRDSTNEDSSHALTAEDEAFSAPPWNEIDASRKGINNLKSQIQDMLLAEIRKHLPRVTKEVRQQKRQCDELLDRMGPSRDSRKAQESFLRKIQGDFQELVKEAVAGRYVHKYLKCRPQERLRNSIRVWNDAFALGMRNCGHEYQIEVLMDTAKPVRGFNQSQAISIDDALSIVQSKVLAYGRGQEMSNNYSHLLGAALFEIQSDRWENLARDYLNGAYRMVEGFLKKALIHVTPSTSSIIWQRSILPQLRAKEEALNSKLQELRRPFSDFWPCYANNRYEISLAEYKKQWLALESRRHHTITDHGQIACKNLLLDMLAYYDTALPTFVDNVISLGVETCLLGGLADLMTTDKISDMNDADLAKLAAEPPEAALRREAEEEKKRTLQSALDKLDDQPLSIDYLDTGEETSLEPANAFGGDVNALAAPNVVFNKHEGATSTERAQSSNVALTPSTPSQAPTLQSSGICTPRLFDANLYVDYKHQPLTPEKTPARSTELSTSEEPGLGQFASYFGRTPSPASDRSRKGRSRGSSSICRQISNAPSDITDPVTGEEIL